MKMFDNNQVEELLKIVKFHHVLFAVENIGIEILSNDDIMLLNRYGIDVNKYLSSQTKFDDAYHLGRLAQALGNERTRNMKYEDFRKFVQAGGYRPLTDVEKRSIEMSKGRSYTHIKGLGNKVGSSLVGIINDEESVRRANYEKIMSEEFESAIADRKSLSEIARNIGKRTGDWQRDLDRVVETEMQNLYQEGRANELEHVKGKDAKVYKDVFPGACRWCIKLYTTNGIGSKPIIFKLSELRANGTNIGKKTKDWKAVLGTVHPYCRCEMHDVPDGFEWDEKTRSFSKRPEGYKKKYDYNVTISIGEKDYTI